MLKDQRQLAIITYLNANTFAKIEQLVTYIGCSEITIRRDIQALAAQNRLIKVHGGAKVINDRELMSDFSLDMRNQTNLNAKNKIAKRASGYLIEGMSVYLDAGSSVSCLIPYLVNKSLKIYTHGVHHIPDLLKWKLPFVIIGGTFKPQTQALVGEVAIEQIARLHLDIAFIGTNAVDDKFGLSTPDMAEAQIKRAIIKHAQRSYVLANKVKLGKKSHVSFAKIDEVTEIISF
ncbi:MAG: DeoR/GlpR family DNA-binding transcription regulator [Culicoidibacterales bacterium]